MRDRLNTIERKRKQSQSVSSSRITQEPGKRTARERINRLLDRGSFQELDLWTSAVTTGFPIDSTEYPTDGVITGYGTVNKKPVYVWSQDAAILNGTIGLIHGKKIMFVMEKALQARVPIIGIIDSEGERAEDSIQYPRFFSIEAICHQTVMASGIIPQISLVMGKGIGELALLSQLTDFVFMVRGSSNIYVAMETECDAAEDIGTAWIHSTRTGCCDLLAENDDDCISKCRALLAYLPLNNEEKAPQVKTKDSVDRREEQLLDLVPLNSAKTYSMYKLISLITDDGKFLELKRYWAQNLIVGIASFGGMVTGIVANNPQNKAGCMELDASDKMARFVRFCDAFNIPLVWLADTPAFLPAVEQEQRGLIRHGCRVIFANSEATVPQITVVIRKLYGGGALAMPGIQLNGDLIVAWPSMERGLMGAEGAVAIIYRGELTSIADEEERSKRKKELVEYMRQRIEMIQSESSQDYIDPRDTRKVIICALQTLVNKKWKLYPRKHENIRL